MVAETATFNRHFFSPRKSQERCLEPVDNCTPVLVAELLGISEGYMCNVQLQH